MFEAIVEADTFEEACEKLAWSTDDYITADDPGTYVDGSFEVNEDVSSERNRVIESKQEKGYWSNKNGWGSLEDATIFEYKPTSFPSIGVSDCRLVTYRDAEMNRVDGHAS